MKGKNLRTTACALLSRRGLLMRGLSWLSLISAGGCRVGEALVDGVYGGISDSVSTLISDTVAMLVGR